ncbi:hypothetical protein ACC756_38430, partial [Rhizobium ruizarguesonis]
IDDALEFGFCTDRQLHDDSRCTDAGLDHLDGAATEAYLEGILPDNDQIRAMVRRGTIDVKFNPMFCGTAFKNKGVQPLLDAVVD